MVVALFLAGRVPSAAAQSKEKQDDEQIRQALSKLAKVYDAAHPRAKKK